MDEDGGLYGKERIRYVLKVFVFDPDEFRCPARRLFGGRDDDKDGLTFVAYAPRGKEGLVLLDRAEEVFPGYVLVGNDLYDPLEGAGGGDVDPL